MNVWKSSRLNGLVQSPTTWEVQNQSLRAEKGRCYIYVSEGRGASTCLLKKQPFSGWENRRERGLCLPFEVCHRIIENLAQQRKKYLLAETSSIFWMGQNASGIFSEDPVCQIKVLFIYLCFLGDSESMGRRGFFWSATLIGIFLHITYFSLEFYIQYYNYLITTYFPSPGLQIIGTKDRGDASLGHYWIPRALLILAHGRL